MSLLYNLSIIAGVTAIALGACYLIVRILVRKELEKSFPKQIKSIRSFFKSQKVRLVLIIMPNGEVNFENFEIIKGPSYVG